MHMKYIFFVIVTFFIFFTSNVRSETIQDRFIFGVCTHLGHRHSESYNSSVEVANKVNQLGAESIRDDLMWDFVGTNDIKDFPVSMKRLRSGLGLMNIRPLLVLKGDSRYIPEGQPKTNSSRELYAYYAKSAASSLMGINPIFEIWNEWNLGAWNKDKVPGTAESYVELVKTTYPEIKKVFPDGLVLAGAVGDDHQWKWTKKAVSLGILDYADGLSVHAYNHCAKSEKRTGYEIIIRLRELHNWLKSEYPERDVPIYLTEVGWPEEDGECGGVNERQVAANVAQIILWGAAHSWLKGVWLYELIDSGSDPADREHHFGLYRKKGVPKLSACAARESWNFISGTALESEGEPVDGIKMVVYNNESQMKHIAIWNTNNSKKDIYVSLPSDGKLMEFCGEYNNAQLDSIRVGAFPILISAKDAADIKFMIGQ